MITNGTIQPIQTTGGGKTPTGDPIAATQVPGTPIECFIKSISQSNKGKYDGGKFTAATFEILIEDQPFDAKRVKLTNESGLELGDFEIQKFELLSIVQRIKITV